MISIKKMFILLLLLLNVLIIYMFFTEMGIL